MEEKNSKTKEFFSEKIGHNTNCFILLFLYIELLILIVTEGNITCVIVNGICLLLLFMKIIKTEYNLFEGYSKLSDYVRIIELSKDFKKDSKKLSNDELVKLIHEKCINEIKSEYVFSGDNELSHESIKYVANIVDSFIVMYMIILDNDESFRILGFSHAESICYKANDLVKKIFESFEYEKDYWELLPRSIEFVEKNFILK